MSTNVKQSSYGQAAWASAFAGVAVFVGVGLISFEFSHAATDLLPASTHIKHWFWLALESIGYQTDGAKVYNAWLAELAANGLARQIKLRMYLSAFFGLLAAAIFAWHVSKQP